MASSLPSSPVKDDDDQRSDATLHFFKNDGEEKQASPEIYNLVEDE